MLKKKLSHYLSSSSSENVGNNSYATWRVEIGKGGRICLGIDLKEEECAGNYRIRCGDVLNFLIPCGVLDYPLEKLLVINPLDQCAAVEGCFDDTNNFFGEWKSEISGSHSFYVMYKQKSISGKSKNCADELKEVESSCGNYSDGGGLARKKKSVPRREENEISVSGKGGEVAPEMVAGDRRVGLEEEELDAGEVELASEEDLQTMDLFLSSSSFLPGEIGGGQKKFQSVFKNKALFGTKNVIIVNPRLSVNNVDLSENAIVMQTVLSRCLGGFPRWKSCIKSSSDLNYNVIHFTPMQTTGESNSCYSIANQNEISSFFFNDAQEREEKEKEEEEEQEEKGGQQEREERKKREGQREKGDKKEKGDEKENKKEDKKVKGDEKENKKEDKKDKKEKGDEKENKKEKRDEKENKKEDKKDKKEKEKEKEDKKHEHQQLKKCEKQQDKAQEAKTEKMFNELQRIVNSLEKEFHVLSTTDLVLNHTANNSAWIAEYPESAYNLNNSPYLRGAYELDEALKAFSDNLVDGKFVSKYGITKYIENESQLDKVMNALRTEVVIPFRVSEWFQINQEKCKANFRDAKTEIRLLNFDSEEAKKNHLKKEVLKLIGIERNMSIDISGDLLRRMFSSEKELMAALSSLQIELNDLANDTENFILKAIRGFVKWQHIDCRKGPVEKDLWNGLTPRYFTEVTSKNGKKHIFANNGWVMGWDARKDFAAAGSLVYLRRELIVWSDCIKLRYGQSSSDAPFLWHWMALYCRRIAEIFHGVRLDNCHSTPLHVAKYMLREARKVRPGIWIYAELFTGDQDVDFHFERELGINALIREAMQTHSLSNLVYHAMKYSGRAAGCLADVLSFDRSDENPRRILKPSLCPVIFFDCTHDNDTPTQKRTPADALSTAAIVTAAACAVGSTRGFDELIPHNLSVVSEFRLYEYRHCGGDESRSSSPKKKNSKSSCAAASELEKEKKLKKINLELNKDAKQVVLRGSWDCWKNDVICVKQNDHTYSAELTLEDHLNPDINEYQYKFIVDGVWIHDEKSPHLRDKLGNINNIFSLSEKEKSKANKDAEMSGIVQAKRILNYLHVKMNQEGYDEIHIDQKTEDTVLISRHNSSRCASIFFLVRSAFSWTNPNEGFLPQIEIEGKIKDTFLSCDLWIDKEAIEKFQADPEKINGLSSNLVMHNDLKCVADVHYNEKTKTSHIKLKRFPAASVLIFSTFDSPHVYKEIQLGVRTHLQKICMDIPLASVSTLLFSCESEERDRSQGVRGSYVIPCHGPLVYAGLCGIVPILDAVRLTGDPNHPLCENVRNGDWLVAYIAERLSSDSHLKGVKEWLQEMFGAVQLSGASRRFFPFYFDLVICSLYREVLKSILAKGSGQLSSRELCQADELTVSLILATLQFYSSVPSAPLTLGTSKPSLAAGLPHFSTGFMRNWGRDTFIALKGILLVTGRFEEAKEVILAYANVCRHSLIPNLLDSGNNPRYNARDATWFFMQSIQDYCLMSPEGPRFLLTPLQLKYSEDPTLNPVSNIADLMHRIMQSHAQIIEFREWNAGRQIDENMSDEGFNIRIVFDACSGVVYGGNEFNCGTWMDKMGSSAKAGNKGIPATPRDGAAVEIIGLIKSTLRFLCKVSEDFFPYKTVNLRGGQQLTYVRWNCLLEARFEKLFYVPKAELDAEYFVDTKFINKREIYKDTHKATHLWCDYQLRPNACVAMTVSPEIFIKEHAISYLNNVEKFLFGDKQLGLKTLDESDYLYRGDYDNSNDSSDKFVAHGFNYHQGPEWLWPLGYFLQAKLIFASCSENEGHDAAFVLHDCMRHLRNHRAHIRKDRWMSLPELTNKDGKFCSHSCPAQAWSVASILSFIHLAAQFSDNPKQFSLHYKTNKLNDEN